MLFPKRKSDWIKFFAIGIQWFGISVETELLIIFHERRYGIDC